MLRSWWRQRRRARRVPWDELNDLLALDPYRFEEAVAAIFRELGFRRVRRTGGSGDLSVDITCRDKDGRLVAIQCKRYQAPNRVGSVEVQQFLGMAKLHHKAQEAMYVTTSDFTRAALALAAQHRDLHLVNGLMLAELLANILGAPDKEVGDPAKALREAGLTAASLAADAREKQGLEHHGVKVASEPDECRCHSTDVRWAGHRDAGGRPVLVCPFCERFATPEEIHEAMIHGNLSYLDEVPGLEPLREAARTRAEARAVSEEDVRLGLLFVRDSVIERKREQAARVALKRILGRKPTTEEVVALAKSRLPDPEPGHSCSVCGNEMPWSRRLGAHWCQDCSHAEFPLADQKIRLLIPTA